QKWFEVYSSLASSGVNVVGGRVAGPAVGGLTLGGGYSWYTVKQFNVVLPDGTITKATPTFNQDLFWALKGGMNRFGIVTSVVLATHPQTPLAWSGFRYYTGEALPALVDAIDKFYATSQDPKTELLPTFYAGIEGGLTPVFFFHDGPNKPPAFDLFDNITSLVDTTHPQSFSDFAASIPVTTDGVRTRGAFHIFSTTALTRKFLEAIRNETVAFYSIAAQHPGTTASFDVGPFTKFGQFATDSAFPHANSPLPLNIYFTWLLPSEDQFWYGQIRDLVARLKAVATAEGIFEKGVASYPNYALANTTAEELYGSVNAAKLRLVRLRIDPFRIMDLAGGFSI
ncbi:hypothetical protein B0H63DRAFT_551550, partial [Podospora didyma]